LEPEKYRVRISNSQKHLSHKNSNWNKKCHDKPQACKDNFKLSDKYPEVENFDRYGYATITSGGISTDCIEHYAQLLRGRKEDLVFRKFDYGSKKKNQEQ
jgi:hypothetical protein